PAFSSLVSIRLFQAALDVMRLSSCSLYGLHAIRQTLGHLRTCLARAAPGPKSAWFGLPRCMSEPPPTAEPHVLGFVSRECQKYLFCTGRECQHLTSGMPELCLNNPASTFIHPSKTTALDASNA